MESVPRWLGVRSRGKPVGKPAVGSSGQYTSVAFPERLAEAGIDPSVGSVGAVGDAYDIAVAEIVIGLFKTELIKPRGPWRTVEQVEIATLDATPARIAAPPDITAITDPWCVRKQTGSSPNMYTTPLAMR
jgi:hypothetical protein